ncbi:hypothetical protein J6590_070146 [Homalodisca vitripennis]|nr:hypothetical protein J6590_070146 [Homalodisca vitripennis]
MPVTFVEIGVTQTAHLPMDIGFLMFRYVDELASIKPVQSLYPVLHDSHTPK